MIVTVKDLFPIKPEDVAEVRAVYNKSEEDMRNDIGMIINWLKKQPHLPQEYDEGRLERFLIRNKCRLEQTKTKLEKYFSLRAHYPGYFDDILNFQLPNFSDFTSSMLLAALPVLTPNKERVLIAKVTGQKLEEFNSKDFTSMVLLLSDLQLSHDYTIGDRFIADFTHFGFNHVKKFTPTSVETVINLYQEAFSGRLTGIHFVNASSAVNTFLGILKLVFPKKLYEKIIIHDDVESLQEFIPKEMLPEDYGGTQKSIQESHNDLCNIIKKEKAFLLKQAKLVANDNLRIGTVNKNDQFGMDGTFKNLRFD